MVLEVKNPSANAGDARDDMGSISGFPGVGNGNTLQYSCLEIPWTKEPGGLQCIASQRVRKELSMQTSPKSFRAGGKTGWLDSMKASTILS